MEMMFHIIECFVGCFRPCYIFGIIMQNIFHICVLTGEQVNCSFSVADALQNVFPVDLVYKLIIKDSKYMLKLSI